MHNPFLLPLLFLLASITAALPVTARNPIGPSTSSLFPALLSRTLDFLTVKRSDWSSQMWGGGRGIEPGSHGDYEGDGEDAVDGEF